MPKTNMRQAVFTDLACGKTSVFQAIYSLDLLSSKLASERKSGGIVYTPQIVAMDMVAMAAPNLESTVLEPSCGRGVFVFALAEFFLAKGDAPEKVAKAMEKNTKAADTDIQAISDILELWRAYWKAKGVSSSFEGAVKTEDSLFMGWSGHSFDLAIGNPPYVRFQNIPQSARLPLQTKYKTCAKGNVDLSYAFVEQCSLQAKKTCLIIPNGWLAASSGKGMRRLAAKTASAAIDFGSRLLFAPVRAYSSIIVLDKDKQSEPIAWRTNLPSEGGKWTLSARAAPRFSEKAWKIGADHTKSENPVISKFAVIKSGIATLRDSLYSFSGEEINGIVHGTDPIDGTKMAIPLAFAPKLVKITKTKSEAAILASKTRIAFPYTEGKAITESDMKKLAPDLLAFFQKRKAELAKRDKGKTSGYEAWYAYGRKQGLTPPKGIVVLLPTMSGDGLQPVIVDTSKTGAFLFVSGYAFEPRENVPPQFVFNSLKSNEAWKWMLSNGKAWNGGASGIEYRSVGARTLATLPVCGPRP